MSEAYVVAMELIQGSVPTSVHVVYGRLKLGSGSFAEWACLPTLPPHITSPAQRLLTIPRKVPGGARRALHHRPLLIVRLPAQAQQIQPWQS